MFRIIRTRRCCVLLASLAVLTACHGTQGEEPSALRPAELLLELPDYCNAPDALCLLPDGNIILSVPNVNDKSQPSVLMKITPDNKAELFYTMPPHPETGKAYSLGVCTSPCGDLYVSDNQEFDTLDNKSRVLRIPMKDGQPGEAVTVVSGLVVANAVLVRDGYLYVSDSVMVPGSQPSISGVFRFKLGEEGVELKVPGTEDPHLIATLKTHNKEIPTGADGLCFDNDGNLYVANFADATIEKIEFDEQGEVKSQSLFAEADFMISADGLFFDTVEEKIYVADLMGNAIRVVSMDGTVTTLAVNGDHDSADGRLDAPSEALLRGREVIASNMNYPFAYTVNKKFGMPATLSVIKLPANNSRLLSPGERRFHHIALVTDEPHPGEIHYVSLKLWATSPDANRNRTEWIRFAPDSPLGKTPVGRMPHVAFLVDDLDKQLEGKEVVAGPVQVNEKLRVAYFMEDGLLVEYMEGEL